MILAAAMVAQADEFVGPFASWFNVKTDFGAKGDGKADDTAAIQRALEAIRDKECPQRVLYFPKGTYRITDTLRQERISHHEPLGTAIIGEDPERTVIRWDGPEGGVMFHYNAWFSALSRLTFDGAGKAGKAIEHGIAFSTATECSDMIFKDVGIGIEAGIRDGIAEVAVLRCRFYRCSEFAISIQNFNTLDWYIVDCWFEECAIAVSNEIGAGNFHVYNSTLLRSKVADFRIKHTNFISLMGNVSIDSARFFHALRAENWGDFETWGSQVTIQDNTIINAKDVNPVIVIENNGPNMVIDNRIRTGGKAPIIRSVPPSDQADLIVIGNTWTTKDAIEVKGRLKAFDNEVVAARAIPAVKPKPVPFLKKVNRPIIAVAAGADAATIQAAIDRAAKLKGKRPVVHLPAGAYHLSETLVIPAGSDVQLIGDGAELATELMGTANPLILVKGPSKATLRNLLAMADERSTGILVENADRGGLIYGEQIGTRNTRPGAEHGFDIDGLKRTPVEMRYFAQSGLRVSGGGEGTQSWVRFFLGSSSRGRPSKEGLPMIDVENGGRLFIRDFWYEGDAWSLLNMKGDGEFACHSMYMCPADENHIPRTDPWEMDVRADRAAFQIDGFAGNVSLTLCSSGGGTFAIIPPSPGLRLYLLGFKTDSGVDFGGEAVEGVAIAEHTRKRRTDTHPDYPWQPTGTETTPDIGTASDDFVREMLVPLRTVKPQNPVKRPAQENDLRLYRVWVDGKTGLRIQAAGF